MKCIDCGTETGADWKTRCMACWKRSKGFTTTVSSPSVVEAPKKGAFPQFVVWEHCDPRIRGDNSSEVYDKVILFGTEKECVALYERQQRSRRYCGNGTVSYNYPVQIARGEILAMGEKRVIYAGRSRISRGEQWEITHGY